MCLDNIISDTLIFVIVLYSHPMVVIVDRRHIFKKRRHQRNCKEVTFSGVSVTAMWCKAKRQYLLTCKVNRYCLLALHIRHWSLLHCLKSRASDIDYPDSKIMALVKRSHMHDYDKV